MNTIESENIAQNIIKTANTVVVKNANGNKLNNIFYFLELQAMAQLQNRQNKTNNYQKLIYVPNNV